MKNLARDIAGGEVFGFLDAVEVAPAESSAYARSNLVFDVIRSRSNVVGRINDLREDLAVIRVMSTMRRLEERFGTSLKEGRWYRLGLQRRDNAPVAWVVAAGSNYAGRPARTNVVGLESLGDSGSASHVLNDLQALCRSGANAASIITNSDSSDVAPTIHAGQALFVRMVDVGQASFCAIHTARDANSPIIGYYDVGGPLFFHKKTFPATFKEASRIPDHGFVALSHWDFDHYSLAMTKLPDLCRLRWMAPNQSVGPNAALFQSMLGSRLTLLDARAIPVQPGVVLLRGAGAPDDRNGSGYVLVARSRGRKVLLCGDVPYDLIPVGSRSRLTGLAVTHHGGKSTANPPAPAARPSKAGVSFGVPNRYRHPDEAFLNAHQTLGWHVSRTFRSKLNRADVWLA